MTPKDYKEAKEAGMVTVAKLNEHTVAISCRCFNPRTGKESDPEVNQFNLQEVRKQMESAEANLQLLKDFLSDMEKATIIGLGG